MWDKDCRGGNRISPVRERREDVTKWSRHESKFEAEILIACSGATRRLFCVIMSVNAM